MHKCRGSHRSLIYIIQDSSEKGLNKNVCWSYKPKTPHKRNPEFPLILLLSKTWANEPMIQLWDPSNIHLRLLFHFKWGNNEKDIAKLH